MLTVRPVNTCCCWHYFIPYCTENSSNTAEQLLRVFGSLTRNLHLVYIKIILCKDKPGAFVTVFLPASVPLLLLFLSQPAECASWAAQPEGRLTCRSQRKERVCSHTQTPNHTVSLSKLVRIHVHKGRHGLNDFDRVIPA